MSKWMVPADQLDDDQNNFLNAEFNSKSNQWINGFPGSGKSILLMHTLAKILEQEPSASICIIYFTHSLKQMYIVGRIELGINYGRVLFKTYLQYQKKPEYFDYILCDEVQDLTPSVLRLMKDNCRKLYLSGDPNQSIFKDNPQTEEPVVNPKEIGGITNATEYQLTTIHRLTKSVIEIISHLMPSMEILSSKRSAKKNDVTPRLAKFDDKESEVNYIIEKAFETIEVEKSIVILLPTHNYIENFSSLYAESRNFEVFSGSKNSNRHDYELFNRHYHNLKLHYVGNSYGDLHKASNEGKIILMTYHSAKGLDFDSVYLPFLDENAYISSKILFMVGLSRSKETLTLSYSGSAHDYLDEIQQLCVSVDTKEVIEEEVFDF
jgi:superfamily I DNA/RNA helicase